jgi:thioredoxin 1
MPIDLNDENFEEEIINSKASAMVDFYADWCGPCKMVGPIIEKLAEEYKGKIVVGKLNVDEASQTSQHYGVMNIPTVVFFKDGEEIDRISGYVGKEEYEKMIKQILG